QELGASLNRNAEDARARVVVELAIERARAAGNRRAELYATLDSFWIPTEGGGLRENAAIARDAAALIPELESLGDDLGLRKAWQLAAMSPQGANKNPQAEAALGHALDHARRHGDRLEESEVSVELLQVSYNGETPVEECMRRCDDVLQRRRGDWMIEAAVAACRGGLVAVRGEVG